MWTSLDLGVHCHYPSQDKWLVTQHGENVPVSRQKLSVLQVTWWTRPCQQPSSLKRDVVNRNDVINELNSGAMRWSVPGGLWWITTQTTWNHSCVTKKKSQSGDKNAFGFLSNAKNLEKNPKFYRANIFQQTHCSVMQCKSDLLQLYILNNN